MEKAYILGGLRSFIGIENGMYQHLPAEKLGAFVLQKVIQKYEIGTNNLDMVIAGNAVGGGGNLTRLMLLEAGISENIPGITVDVQCGSSLESIAIAAAKIQSGQADVIIAGGFESSSTAPYRSYHENHPDYDKYGGKDSRYRVAKFVPHMHCENIMLAGAELTAKEQHITRAEMDEWALRSHQRAKEAREKQIVNEITVALSKEKAKDEGIRERMSDRLLKRLPPVVKDGETITAGNACLTNDGAAFLVLCSKRYLEKTKKKAQAVFVQAAQTGGNPMQSPLTAVSAIEKLLAKTGLTQEQIDLFECNEAFALIDVLFARKYPDRINDYNIYGGALAYGHPYGASGGIILLHLLKALEERKGRYGICSIAAAGGMGTSILIEAL